MYSIVADIFTIEEALTNASAITFGILSAVVLLSFGQLVAKRVLANPVVQAQLEVTHPLLGFLGLVLT